jgi:hypothetical protein
MTFIRGFAENTTILVNLGSGECGFLLVATNPAFHGGAYLVGPQLRTKASKEVGPFDSQGEEEKGLRAIESYSR